MTEADVRKVVKVLSSGLRLMLPAGIGVEEVDGQLGVTTDAGTEYILLGQNIGQNLAAGLSDEDAIIGASLSMLNELQDIVTKVLTVPWPPQSATHARDFALPHAEIRGGTLRLWFGDELEDKKAATVRVKFP